MQPIDFNEVLEQILLRDPRYPREAYGFVREALDSIQKSLPPDRTQKERHVTGQQLLEGIRQLALKQFGPMALTVFDEWGIHRCEDFGEIVFNMVETQLLGKTDNDSRDDFKGGYDFDEAFRKPYRPEARPPAQPAVPVEVKSNIAP